MMNCVVSPCLIAHYVIQNLGYDAIEKEIFALYGNNPVALNY